MESLEAENTQSVQASWHEAAHRELAQALQDAKDEASLLRARVYSLEAEKAMDHAQLATHLEDTALQTSEKEAAQRELAKDLQNASDECGLLRARVESSEAENARLRTELNTHSVQATKYEAAQMESAHRLQIATDDAGLLRARVESSEAENTRLRTELNTHSEGPALQKTPQQPPSMLDFMLPGCPTLAEIIKSASFFTSLQEFVIDLSTFDDAAVSLASIKSGHSLTLMQESGGQLLVTELDGRTVTVIRQGDRESWFLEGGDGAHFTNKHPRIEFVNGVLVASLDVMDGVCVWRSGSKGGCAAIEKYLWNFHKDVRAEQVEAEFRKA